MTAEQEQKILDVIERLKRRIEAVEARTVEAKDCLHTYEHLDCARGQLGDGFEKEQGYALASLHESLRTIQDAVDDARRTCGHLEYVHLGYCLS